MPDVPPETAVPAGGPTDPSPPNPTGLQLVLGEGEGGGAKVDRASVPPATKLDDAAVKALIARLPKLEGQAGDDVPFAFRERSLPVPRAGETVKTPFPPPVAPGAVTAPDAEQGALEVRRFGPEGDVPVAPQLSITFSQPMVPVTSHEELKKLPIPVQLTPSLEGEWKWVGTKTLTFDAKVRLPMATEFKATVPAGTASVTSGKLEKEVSWAFRTPAPRVLAFWPGDYLPTQLRPIIALRFDQRIDEQAILPFVKVKYGALGAERAVRLATEAELAADLTAKSVWTGSAAEKGRAIAVIPVEDLPAAETFSIVLTAGAPSAEGPRKTDKDQTSSFQTYGPFKFKELHCGWNDNCPPLHPWSLEFTNGIDTQAFEPGSVTISPELPNARIEAMGNNIVISGASKGRTTYRLTVKAGLKDIFGQVLAKDLETSVKVTKAEPILVTPSQKFILADPMGDGSISVSSINHQEIDVKLYRVSPKDFPTYLDYANNVTYKKDRKSPPGKALWEKRVKIASVEDEMVETKIDLRPALDDGFGSVMVWVRPVIQPPDNEYYEDVRVTWVQRTQLAVDAIMDGETVYALVTSLQTGLPVDGADVSLQPEGMQAKSGAAGIAELALPESHGQGRWLVASKDKDVVFLPENVYWNGGSSWVKSTQGPYVRWYVFDDRGLYRPKEQVRFKGWMRLIGGGKMPTVQGLDAGITGVRWTLIDSRGNEVAKGTAPVTALGGFDGTLTLPDTMNLGPARLELVAEGASATGGNTSWTFQVQEFRRPEFEVSSVVSDGPFLVGGNAVVTTTAKYFAGGTLPGAKVDWSVSGSQTSYTPPNRWDYAFGSWTPWWSSESRSAASLHLNYEGTTDSAGTHRLELRFDSVNPPRPWSLTTQSTVQDVNRQTFSASSSLLVHPSDRYVGIKSERDFLKSGEPIDVSLIVTDIDGNLQPGVAIDVECVRLEWGYEKGNWTQEEKDRETCTVTSADKDVSCSFTPKAGGAHQIKARIKDASGRANESQREFYVPGGKQRIEREIKEESVTLIPNKKEYAVGDTAEIFVTSPWPRADGLVTISVAGVVETQPITIGADGDGNSTVVKVKIQEGFMPDVRVRVDLTGEAERLGDDGKSDPKLPKRPAHASGTVSLAVPPVTRTLTVKPVPAEADLPPGGQTQVAVTVTDHEGKPVPGAEVAIVVVDESVLALTGYRIGDPVATFYGGRYGASRIHKLRGFLILDDPAALLQAAAKGAADGRERAAMKSMPMPSPAAPAMAESAGAAPAEEAEGGSGGGDAGGPIAVRKNFDPLALFAAATPTDEAGVATVQVTLPDNLTRYRITAVAVEGGKHFGLGDATLTARLPLMVRPSAPRFLNFGDTFELPIVLQNQTSAPMEVNVAVSALGVELSDGAGRKVTVPANDRVEVRFPAAVARVGKARFQIGASTGKWSDAANIELPIWTPATTEAFATYGTIDKGAIAQPVKMPGDVFTQFGGLEVSTASTNLQALTDAVLYLVSYPFECSEQISSRI
ncbi:MAG: hypothetical protein IV100_23675, partial [Myxococcales bacterium]|nr:hypothetical protein [Myxococcales bacterium]